MNITHDGSKIRIGLFGGTFDPPHWGHIRAARGAADELVLSQIQFILAAYPPHKLDRPLTPFAIRQQMLELCLPLDPRFRVCSIEEEENLPGTTLNTVLRIREVQFPSDSYRLIWLMGSDSLLDFSAWHQPDQLLKIVDIAVMPRPGYPVEKADPQFLRRVRILNTPLIDISADEIRNRKMDLTNAVPDSVAQYVLDSGLYNLR